MEIVLFDVGAEEIAVGCAVGDVVLRGAVVGGVEENPALNHVVLFEGDERAGGGVVLRFLTLRSRKPTRNRWMLSTSSAREWR